jgi:holliday junction DNA helicase RuvA
LGAEGAARAIALGDARAIQAAQGIGPKIAQRVVLELKSKAPATMALGGGMQVAAAEDEVVETASAPRAAVAAVPGRAAATADALSALVNLGYSQGDAAEAVSLVAAETAEADTGTLIRLALRRLAPKS